MRTIDDVMKAYQTITDFGFGKIDGLGQRMTPKEFQIQRKWLLENKANILKTRLWIKQNITKRKTFNEKSHSYGLKHTIERDIGYITNGVCIAAMILEGYKIKRCGYGPNCIFNASFKKPEQ